MPTYFLLYPQVKFTTFFIWRIHKKDTIVKNEAFYGV